MSFSLRWLFAFVAIAAVFAAALESQTPLWVAIIFNSTVVVLAAATLVGVLSNRSRTFWLCFAVVGWLHLILNSLPFTKDSIPAKLLTRRLAYKIWESSNGDAYYGRIVPNAYPSEKLYYHIQAEGAMYSDEFARFVDITQNLCTLLLAVTAGVIASYLVQRSSKTAEH